MFHVAADYRLWSKHPDDLYHSNVDGTRNLLDAAVRARVERVVYTSTVGCIGMPQDRPGDENTPISIADMPGHYKRSKWLAERVALEKAAEGLPVVIVNPTAPIGDHDWKPTPTGKIIVDFLRDKFPAFVDTGFNLVDVRDTARGHLLAAERGRAGERYILGCENLTLQQILGRLAALTGKKAPTDQVPLCGCICRRRVARTAWANMSGSAPLSPARGSKDGAQENVCHSREGVARTGFCATAGRGGFASCHRMVSRERVLLNDGNSCS